MPEPRCGAVLEGASGTPELSLSLKLRFEHIDAVAEVKARAGMRMAQRSGFP